MLPRLALLLLLGSPSVRAQVVDLPGLPHEPFYSIAARGDTLLAGSAGGLYISSDAGRTWQALGQLAPEVTSIDALVLTDHGWFAGAFGEGVYLSRDGGRTWQAWSSGLAGIGARHIVALQERDGWLYAATDGSGVFRLRLHPLGTWERYGTIFAEYEAESVYAMSLHEEALVVSSGGNGLVFTEHLDQGTWTPVSVGTQVLGFTSAGDTLVAISTRQCRFSTDGGLTWQHAAPGLPNGLYATLARTEHHVFASRTTGEGVSQLFATADLTAGWHLVGTTSETFRMLAHGDRLYLAQMDGLRAYVPLPVYNEPGTLPAPRRLHPPSPNPATGFTRITFTLDHPGPVLIAAYDLHGRLVATPYEGMAPAGETAVVWSTTALTPGVYRLRLSTPGATETRSFVVLR